MARGLLLKMEKGRELAGGAIIQVHTGTEVYESNGLDDLQRAVGGLIEAIQLAPGIHGWINEEGKLIELPVNDVATIMFRRAYPGTRDVICGSMLLMGENRDGSEDADLPDEWFAAHEAHRPLHTLIPEGEPVWTGDDDA